MAENESLDLGERASPMPWAQVRSGHLPPHCQDVLRRYRQEWIDLVRKGQRQGWNWAKWLSVPSVAA